jgi:hypothetical protein
MSNILANKVQLSFTYYLVLVSIYKLVAMIYRDLKHNLIWLTIHCTTIWIHHGPMPLDDPCYLVIYSCF